MSVCFFVNADQAGTSSVSVEEIEGDGAGEEGNQGETSQQTLEQFWAKVTDDIRNVSSEDFKTQALPLARIKKIMKLDEEVKMISAEAPVLFAKAVEIFIHELTLRAWSHTEDNKRRTLQRNDIAMAISKSDQFDFLIDIVPRQEIKANKPRYETVWSHAKPQEQTVRTQQPCLQQQTQQHSTLQQTAQQPQIVLQPMTQVVQAANPTPSASSNPHPVALVQAHQVVSNGELQNMPAGAAQASNNPHPVALVQAHQVVPNGELQNIPSQIQLTQAQLNMIRLQVQNNPNQPIIIQAQPQQSPQIIQVTSQGQHQPQQQVYIAQVRNSQDES